MSDEVKPKYVEIKAQSKAQVEQGLRSNDVNVICNALYSAAQHEPDWRWTQTRSLEMLKHESPLVRSSALIALGEIALFRGQLDFELVVSEMRKLSSDPAMAPFVEDALDNIRAAKLRSR